jgi:hypothetical protein
MLLDSWRRLLVASLARPDDDDDDDESTFEMIWYRRKRPSTSTRFPLEDAAAADEFTITIVEGSCIDHGKILARGIYAESAIEWRW